MGIIAAAVLALLAECGVVAADEPVALPSSRRVAQPGYTRFVPQPSLEQPTEAEPVVRPPLESEPLPVPTFVQGPTYSPERLPELPPPTSTSPPQMLPPQVPSLAPHDQSLNPQAPAFSGQVQPAQPRNGLQPDTLPQPQSADPLMRTEQNWFDEDHKPMSSLGLSITPNSGDMPPDLAAARFESQPPTIVGARPATAPLKYHYGWAASNLCHNPLYFEEPDVERYGRSHGYLMQPVVSGAHFFTNVALLPAKMTVHPPRSWECSAGNNFHSRSNFLQQHPVLRYSSGLIQSSAMTARLLLP